MNYVKPSADLYQRTTDLIVEQLELGVSPWMRPWDAINMTDKVMLPVRHNGEPYKGVNVLTLWITGYVHGYRLPHHMTYKQAQALGGQVRAGERGHPVVYADRIKKTETNDKGEDVERQIPFLKAYTVFNAEQIDGLPARFYERPERKLLEVPERLQAADEFMHNTGIKIVHGGNRAYYAPGPDHIAMPPYESFTDREAYYSTAFHELTHATAHKTRCNRVMRFDRKTEEYKTEECIAELGAAFLCAGLEITLTPRREHASYIASWIAGMKADKRFIFRVAADAQKAVDYLFSLQPQPDRPSSSTHTSESACSPA